MYLRRNNRIKNEVSFDEPLNIDWDGNELLLSDILGTENDEVYHHIEEEVNYNLLSYVMKKLVPERKGYYGDALRPCKRRRNDAKGGCR